MNPIYTNLLERRAAIAATMLGMQFLEGTVEFTLADQLRQHAYLKGQLDLLNELIADLETPPESGN